MPIVTTDVTQQKIHTSSHGGGHIAEQLLARLGIDSIKTKTTRKKVLERVAPDVVARYSSRGFVTGKEHRGLKLSKCSTDLFGENDSVLWTLEVKYSKSSKTCKTCKKTEDVHTQLGCPHPVRPNHKNCGNRFRDAVGSITRQRNCNLVRNLGKRFIAGFLYIDLVEVGTNVHSFGDESDMDAIRRAGGVVEVFTHIPTSDELDAVVDRLCDFRFGLVYS